MKNLTFKKTVSIVLAVIILFAMTVPAFSRSEPDVPLICILGIGAVPLVANSGTDNEYNVFPPGSESIKGIGNQLGNILAGIGSTRALFSTINSFLLPIACDEAGNPIDSTTDAIKYPKSLAFYDDDVLRYNYARAYGSLTGERIGWDNVYVFTLDWRLDAKALADELSAYIENVKAEKGVDKVNIVASSMGAVVMLTYITEYYSEAVSSLNNLVFLSPAIMGTSLAGELLSGKFRITAAGVAGIVNDLTAGANPFIGLLAGLFTDTFLWGAKQMGLSTNRQLEQLKDDFYEYTAPLAANFLGLWNLVPTEYIDDALAFMFPNGVNTELKAKVDYYLDVRSNAEATITNIMSDGVRVSIVSNYDKQMLPVIENDKVQSDMIIDTRYTSFGATCADIGKTFPSDYTQKIALPNNHLSPDRVIDASTCMFPEITWFIKGLSHTDYNINEEPVKLIMWLLAADEQKTVFSSEEFPQFLSFNKANGKMVPTAVQSGRPFSDIGSFFRHLIQILRSIVNKILGLY